MLASCWIWTAHLISHGHRGKIVKLPLYRPGQTLKCKWCSVSENFQTVGTRSWKGFQSHAPVVFTPHKIFLVLISVTDSLDPSATVRPEIVCQIFSVIPHRIEPPTFRLVAQCLKQQLHSLCYGLPAFYHKGSNHYCGPLREQQVLKPQCLIASGPYYCATFVVCII